MKPITILFKFSLAVFFIAFVAGCNREKGCTDINANNYNANTRQDNGTCKYNGTATFYSLYNGPTATVTINGQSAVIPQFFNTAVTACNSTGCANFTVPSGTYPYTASSSLSTWSGTISVDPNGCSIIQLANPNTTFYSPTYTNITVSIAGQTGKITQTFAANPGCAVSGCANFFLNSGNYSFSATDGTHMWGPTSLTVDETTCNPVVLQ